MSDSQPEILVLDAMGVIYAAGDDVAKLLVPFVKRHGGLADTRRIEAAYLEASLGLTDATEFWRCVEVSDELEDEYLALHRLTDGLVGFLRRAAERFEAVYCLSNDLARWSIKLRKLSGLESFFDGWYISGELGLRKPDPAIYRHLLGDVQAEPQQVVFVDDRVKNLDPAAALGVNTVLFDPQGAVGRTAHRSIARLDELL